MADVSLAMAPVRSATPDVLERLGLEPGGYLRHDASIGRATSTTEQLARLVELLSAPAAAGACSRSTPARRRASSARARWRSCEALEP